MSGMHLEISNKIHILSKTIWLQIMPVIWTALKIKKYSKEEQSGVRHLKYDKSRLRKAMDAKMGLYMDGKTHRDRCFDSPVSHSST